MPHDHNSDASTANAQAKSAREKIEGFRDFVDVKILYMTYPPWDEVKFWVSDEG
jgi:hypothetical protein